ncbi:hypothetical protein [Chitinophaga sp.]|uniref:hypothetical protein n=1 Tax=Chitinophaga sp. TaxID=1869181 RepID=UPI002F94C13A
MKLLTSSFLAAMLLFFACKPAADKGNDQAANDDSLALTKLQGTYMGDFGGAPIYITLNYANGKQVAGYNVHKGLRRNLRGELKKDNDSWIISLSEPGDHPFDGKFELTFDHLFAKGKGTWTPLNSSTLKEKTFVFEKSTDKESESYGMNGNTFNQFLIGTDNSKSDLQFSTDGSCLLQLYEKVNDSTFADQMIKIKGTYQKSDDSTLVISWEKNTHFKERTNTARFLSNGDTDGDGRTYFYGVRIDTLEFVEGP